MSAPVRRHAGVRRWLPRLTVAVALAVLTGSIAAALQVRRVVVEGATGPIVEQVHAVLAAALGSPTLVMRAEELRAAVLNQVAWVAEAAVSVSLDGVVRCAVTLRRPIAVLADGPQPLLVDDGGRVLGEPVASTPIPPLELIGFGAHPEERAALLAALPALQASWGGTVRRVQRLGPRDVAIFFDGAALHVVADPSRPEGLAAGRTVLAAWQRFSPAAVRRLDVRVPGRVALLPASAESGT